MKKRMLKIISSLLATILCTATVSFADTTYEDESTVGLIINEKWVSVSQPPILQNDRTLVPIRVISETLGFDVEWEETERKVTVSDADTTLELFIDQPYIINNSEKSEMDVAPIIWFDTTMVPLRKVSELLGCDVEWNGIAYVVLVNSPEAVERYSKLSPENPVFTEQDTILRGHIEKMTYASEITAMTWDTYHLVLEQRSDFVIPSERSASGTMTYKNVKRVELCPEYDSSLLDKFVGKYVSSIGEIRESPNNMYATTDIQLYISDLN